MHRRRPHPDEHLVRGWLRAWHLPQAELVEDRRTRPARSPSRGGPRASPRSRRGSRGGPGTTRPGDGGSRRRTPRDRRRQRTRPAREELALVEGLGEGADPVLAVGRRVARASPRGVGDLLLDPRTNEVVESSTHGREPRRPPSGRLDTLSTGQGDEDGKNAVPDGRRLVTNRRRSGLNHAVRDHSNVSTRPLTTPVVGQRGLDHDYDPSAPASVHLGALELVGGGRGRTDAGG